MSATALIEHCGGCHCSAVRWRVLAPARVQVLECNCSICRMTGFLHLIVPASRFALLQGAPLLTEYRFNTGTARHLFCSVCGIKSFYVPRSHPDGYSIDLRCIDPGTLQGYTVQAFDDTRRQASTAAVAQLSREDGRA